MLKENISLSQLITLVINFLLGSAIVVGVGMEAKRDAWIVIIAGLFIGLLIISAYYFLLSLQPGKNFFEILEICFSRPVAIVMSLGYICYFLYIACRVIRDFGEMISAAILPLTPIEVTVALLALVIGYILYMGIEVLGRTSEIFTPYTFAFMLMLFIFLYGSGNIEISNLEPVAANGWKPIVKAIVPSISVFPYGEMIAFTVVLADVTNFKYSRVISIFGVIIASMLLLLSVFLIITSLGENIALRSNFPLLSAARLVSIGEFIERIDALVVFIIMLGILIKSSVFIYGGLKGLEYVFNKPYRFFSIPIACIVSMFSIFISTDFSDHIREGLYVDIFVLHLPMEYGVPILILVTLLFKKWRKDRSAGKEVKA
ncbi:spore germination protein [Niallia taxi]|uniref:GerAB/ArcD/ProY family transporter n=1 Tax=Niallia taxi TaxID=2499688 RepID=UPI0029344F66|nr:GerAB/ArcD/ProY family transporter [Niallia taxi]WOD62832.1 spore germination protein [Niallia taxi]